MTTLALVVGILSLLCTVLTVREFLHLTRKRTAILQALSADQRYLQSRRMLLVWLYVITSALWTVGLWWYFLRLLS